VARQEEYRLTPSRNAPNEMSNAVNTTTGRLYKQNTSQTPNVNKRPPSPNQQTVLNDLGRTIHHGYPRGDTTINQLHEDATVLHNQELTCILEKYVPITINHQGHRKKRSSTFARQIMNHQTYAGSRQVKASGKSLERKRKTLHDYHCKISLHVHLTILFESNCSKVCRICI